MALDVVSYALSMGYTSSSLDGAGSLKGKDGLSAYELAVNNGYTGSLNEWLKTLVGTNGKDGVDGITPHIGSNGNWFLGKTDTNCKASISENEITEKVNTQVNAYLAENGVATKEYVDEVIGGALNGSY